MVSLLFLLLLSKPVPHPDANDAERLGLTLDNIAVWLASAVDYVVRLRLTTDRRRFVRTCLADLAVVPLPALRLLRRLRLLALTRMIAGSSRGALPGSILRTHAG